MAIASFTHGEAMTNQFAIVENNLVVNVTLSTPEFAASQGWVALSGDAWIGWGYVDGVFVPPPPEDYSGQNKQAATDLLSATDWSCTVDIAEPQYSNPYLANQADFLAYRSEVRKIAVSPPKELVTDWPLKPEAHWVSV